MDLKYIFDYMSDGIFAAIFLMKLVSKYTCSNATQKKNNHQFNKWVYWLKQTRDAFNVSMTLQIAQSKTKYDRSSTHDFRLSLVADLEMTTVYSQTHINLVEKLVSLARKKK